MSQVYVNKQLGNDFNPGGPELPLMSIGAAIASPTHHEIFIQDGIYTELINAAVFDQVQRKIIGIGDVYIAAQGNPSSFIGKLTNRHVFKNIKFVNYTAQALELAGANIVLSSCFFKPLQTNGSSAIFVNPTLSSTITTLDIRKCTILNNQFIVNINPAITITALKFVKIENTLFFGHQFQIKNGSSTYSFSTYLTAANDKGNYYDNNTHLTNGGIDSNAGENPPLFVDAANGNYDLQTTSTLIGAGYLGSDIGSFHDFTPFTSTVDEPISVTDAGWQNDSRYFDIASNTVGPEGPPDATGIILVPINGEFKWVLDLANKPSGRSGRLLSPVIDFQLIRTITRASWAAFENSTLTSGNKQIISNSNLIIPDLEIRGSLGPLAFDDLIVPWMSFNRHTAINLSAKFAQTRLTFRLNGT